VAGSNERQKTAQAIRKLYTQQPWAQRIFDHFGDRTNNSSATKIDSLANLLKVTVSEATAVAKELQAAGLGVYVVGRKGNPSRIEWHFTLASMAKSARGERDDLESISPDEEEGGTVDAGGLPLQLTIAEAKEALARTLGISPDQIEITIKA
jgi:hypothetical protein